MTELPTSQDAVVSTDTPAPRVEKPQSGATSESGGAVEPVTPGTAIEPGPEESTTESPGVPLEATPEDGPRVAPLEVVGEDHGAPTSDEATAESVRSEPGSQGDAGAHGQGPGSAEAQDFDGVPRDGGSLDADSESDPETQLEPEGTPDPFAALPGPLKRALEARGFESLTPVQTAVLEAEAEGRDLQISSQTGSGKTVALGFVLASHLVEKARADQASESSAPRPKGPVALIIVPTRELATQVCSELRWLLSEIPNASVASVTGGTPIFRDRQVLSRGPQVLVGTPGRLLDHVSNGALELGSVCELVLDEADQMLDMGFREELEGILDTTPSTRRTHMVSATFPAGILHLAERYQSSPFTIEGTRLGEANRDIEHIGHFVHGHDRYAALVNLLLLADGERTLVFIKQRAEALALAEQLEADGFAALPLSGELAQSQRTRTLAAFRSGGAHVLVATDVAARGLDVPDVTMVVHTAPPMDSQVYTHRSGRTGRAGMRGKSVLFTPPSRRRKVERLMGEAGVRIEWQPVPEAAQVKAELAERDRKALTDGIASSLAEEKHLDHLEHAEALVAEHGAAPLVAALLAERGSRRRAEPRDLENPVRRDAQRRDRNDRERFGGQQRPYGERGAGGTRQSYARPGYQDSRGSKPWERNRPDGRERGYGKPSPDHRPGGDRPREQWAPEDRGYGAPNARHGNESRPHGRPQDNRGSWQRDERGGFGDRPQGDRPAYARPSFEPGHRERSGRDRPDRGGRRDDGEMVRFFMNWGGNQGANPRRLLAAVCRRGEVQGTDIGSIAIHPNASTFDVRREVAERFEHLASRRDPRDPQTRIRRDRGPMAR